MSFNFLEIAKSSELANAALPTVVTAVELVEFPLEGSLADLVVALRLENGYSLAFSLRQPWVGLFFVRSGGFRASKQTWAAAFDGAQDWNTLLRGSTLFEVRAENGERIVSLGFHSKEKLGSDFRVVIELFPARPNWSVDSGGKRVCWREDRPKRDAAGPAAGLRPITQRDFGSKSEVAADWMAAAYRHYFEQRQKFMFEATLQKGLTQLQARLGQLNRIRQQLDDSAREASQAEKFKLWGEKIKSVLFQYAKDFRAKQLTVVPVGEDGASELLIRLDDALSLSENADRYFQKYKKAERAKKEVEARRETIEAETRRVSSALARFRAVRFGAGTTTGAAAPMTEATTSSSAPLSFRERYANLVKMLKESGVKGVELDQKNGTMPVKRVEKKWAKSGLKSFESKERLRIWVGRDHAENEELVIRLARGNDIWMHLKNRPGAHVVVQVPNGKSASLETLLDGATLAAYYSNVKEGEKVDVDYTFRKYVKRVSGKSGDIFLVTYTQNKTLVVKVEESRLWRLLKQESSS